MDFLAYLDPGTGSLILQAVIGIGAGIAFFTRSYWHKLKGLFSKKESKDDKKK